MAAGLAPSAVVAEADAKPEAGVPSVEKEGVPAPTSAAAGAGGSGVVIIKENRAVGVEYTKDLKTVEVFHYDNCSF